MPDRFKNGLVHIELHAHDSVVRVQVIGLLGGVEYRELRNVLKQLDPQKIERIVLDCSRAATTDECRLSELLETCDKLNTKCAPTSLLPPTRSVSLRPQSEPDAKPGLESEIDLRSQ